MLEGEELARCQAGIDELLPPKMAAWLNYRQHAFGIARHSFADVRDGVAVEGSRKDFGIGLEDLLQIDESGAALRCIDSDRVAPLIRRIVHPSAADFPQWASYTGDAQCTGLGVSIYPPDADRAGYTCERRGRCAIPADLTLRYLRQTSTTTIRRRTSGRCPGIACSTCSYTYSIAPKAAAPPCAHSPPPSSHRDGD